MRKRRRQESTYRSGEVIGRLIVAALCLAPSLTFEPGFAGDELGTSDTPPAARIADVAWIAGRWTLAKGDGLLEELWSAPEGDCMMGVFRWIRNGKVWIYELLTIREENGSLAFRFRHFGNDMNAWEEKDKPISYGLNSLSQNEVIFENTDSEKARRYIFRKTDDGMLVRLESEKDGRIGADEFPYKCQ